MINFSRVYATICKPHIPLLIDQLWLRPHIKGMPALLTSLWWVHMCHPTPHRNWTCDLPVDNTCSQPTLVLVIITTMKFRYFKVNNTIEYFSRVIFRVTLSSTCCDRKNYGRRNKSQSGEKLNSKATCPCLKGQRDDKLNSKSTCPCLKDQRHH